MDQPGIDRHGEASDATGELVTLADGGRVLIRPLLPTDRQELARRYLELSPESRRLRFFNAPDHLSERLLDHLLDVDGHDRTALVAVAVDEEGGPGVGIARYVRRTGDPTSAEAAVTVVDDHQRRGIGTLLLHRLAEQAWHHGITSFTASVMWENRDVLDALRDAGAVIHPSEPGVAAVRVALPEPADEPHLGTLQRILRTLADRLGDALHLRIEH